MEQSSHTTLSWNQVAVVWSNSSLPTSALFNPPKKRDIRTDTSMLGLTVMFCFCYLPECFWTQFSCLARELHRQQEWLQLCSLLCLQPATCTQSCSAAHEELKGESVGAMGERRDDKRQIKMKKAQLAYLMERKASRSAVKWCCFNIATSSFAAFGGARLCSDFTQAQMKHTSLVL